MVFRSAGDDVVVDAVVDSSVVEVADVGANTVVDEVVSDEDPCDKGAVVLSFSSKISPERTSAATALSGEELVMEAIIFVGLSSSPG